MILSVHKLALTATIVASLTSLSTAKAEEMVILPKPDATQWGRAPPTLPKGSKLAVLFGDPSKPGPFVLRIWAPAHSIVPPHTHNGAEMLTVISGKIYHEMGPKFDKNGGDPVEAGGFVYLPAQMVHSTRAGDEVTVVQVSGAGPFGINFVNPADDPSKQP
jgi:quercetin dioxygenase-like cupin family protein